MIIVNIKWGVGNQIFQYAFGRALSYKYNEPLLLDLSWFENPGSDTNRKFVLDKFNIKALIASKEDLDRFNVYKKGIRKITNHLLPLSFKKIVVEKTQIFKKKYMMVNKNVMLIGTWMNERYFFEIRNQIKNEINFNFQLNDYQSNIHNLILNNNSVSIHIRRGDYANNEVTKKYHGLLDKKF